MPSRVVCDNSHWGGLCRDAAREIHARGALIPCNRKGCNSLRRYIATQMYPLTKVTSTYELKKVARLYSDVDADKVGYDPMLLLLENRTNSADLVVWPFYWIKNRHGAWHVGQFPPQLSLADLRNLMEEIEG